MRDLKARAASLLASGFLGLAMLGTTALAAPNGQPQPGQMNLPAPATGKMADIVWFHNWLIVLITLICVFVLALLIYVSWRFRESRNPTPSKLTHHTGLEVAWTVIPIFILVIVAFPSFRILKDQLTIPPSDITIKVTGVQWAWQWEYPKDAGGFRFRADMLDETQRMAEINAGRRKADETPRLLAVSNEAVVPVGKVVRLQVTAGDVIHQFAMPAFGVKLLAVPGRLNETWFKADKEGIYYGQCQFVCGQSHAFMPVAIRVVSPERYAQWLEQAKTNPDFEPIAAAPAPTRVAAVQAQ
jgi:cytochrome c oxidase subunit 2